MVASGDLAALTAAREAETQTWARAARPQVVRAAARIRRVCPPTPWRLALGWADEAMRLMLAGRTPAGFMLLMDAGLPREAAMDVVDLLRSDPRPVPLAAVDAAWAGMTAAERARAWANWRARRMLPREQVHSVRRGPAWWRS